MTAIGPSCGPGGCEPPERVAPESRQTAPADASDPAEKPHDAGTHRNRLATETSPYLLMHAGNPVDWYPWGEEALAKAKAENKPIFLSVGYSSCYWCHVMERESFMDREIAQTMNEHFVCVKVDREERPDVDAVYMAAVQIMTGRGGWPMSVFLTPDARPFYGGTYFPARDGDRPGVPGMTTILREVHRAWTEKPEKIEASAEQLTALVRANLEGQLPKQGEVDDAPLDGQWLDRVERALVERFDPRFGGFGYQPISSQAPKFPEPSNLVFLLERAERRPPGEGGGPGDLTARRMLTTTLEKMAMGGIRDHVGGGFHRYSVDRFWQIPHFEKMLYDNGHLASLYARAHALTGRDDFRRVTVELLDFVLRELKSPEGGFFSALDAESEAVEGKFYRWKKEEPRDVLDSEQWNLFAEVFGFREEPNFEEHFYVPQLHQPLSEWARQRETDESKLADELAPIHERLLAVRNRRVRPLTDTKILTSWNGLMITGLAVAGDVLEEPRYVEAAQNAADFALERLQTEDGRLLRTYGDGKAKLNAYLDDYALLAEGLIALHRATGRRRYLDAADRLTEKQIELFWDASQGGFFFTSADHEKLLARGKDWTDSALPAGNSVAAANLIYLAEALDRTDYMRRARQTIRASAPLLRQAPSAAPRMAVAVQSLLDAERRQQTPAEAAPPAE